MNDCFWNWIGACKCSKFGCPKYLSVNGDIGSEMLESYEKEVEKVITPIQNNWAKKREDFNN